MAYHTPLTNSQEFTAALQVARELAHNITLGMRNITGTSSDFEVFPYTYVLFYFPRSFMSPLFYRAVEEQFLVDMKPKLYFASLLSG